MPKILLIDDDEELATPLIEYFSRFDLELFAVTHPQAGLAQIQTERFDLIILDVMLPDMDGFEVCRNIRKYNDIPIIMLTARGDLTDKVVGLELGADDYLSKPFEPRELVARIKSILKRANTKQSSKIISFLDFSLNTETQDVIVCDNLIEFTNTEYRLLELLTKRQGHPFSRDEIINALRGVEADIFSRAVDVLISRIRHKIKPLDYIKTVRGAGYSFVAASI